MVRSEGAQWRQKNGDLRDTEGLSLLDAGSYHPRFEFGPLGYRWTRTMAIRTNGDRFNWG